MRDTLTVIAIAVILILTGALVVPQVVDWDRERGRIETEMTARLGLPVRVRGAIGVRLLPAPRLVLGKVALGDQDPEKAPISIERLVVEVEAVPLLRGEFRVAEATIESPRLSLSALGGGDVGQNLLRLAQRMPADAISIERLAVTDAFVLPADLDGAGREPIRLSGSFSAQTLAGPWRGSGEATLEGRRYDFKLATGRIEADGRVRLRLALHEAREALDLEFDGAGALLPGNGTPLKLDGKVTASAPARFLSESGGAPTTWRLVATGSTRGNSFEAETVEFEAGPEGALKLAGSGRLSGEGRLHLALDLGARQLDLDRLAEGLGLARGGEIDAAAASRALAGIPLPVDVTLALERLIAGGEAHGPVAAKLLLGRGRVEITTASAELAARTQVTFAGRVVPADKPVLSGQFSLAVGDPSRAAVALLGLKGLDPYVVALKRAGPISASGTVLVEGGEFSVRDGRARIGSAGIEGRLRLRTGEAGRPAIDVEVETTEVDLDLLSALASGAEGGADVTLVLKSGAAYSQATGEKNLGRLSARLRTGAGSIEIERLELSGEADTRVVVFGRMSEFEARLSAEIEARRLESVSDLMRPILPAGLQAALLARAAVLSPVKLTLSLRRGADAEVSARIVGTLQRTRIDGDVTLAAPADDTALGGVSAADLTIEAPDTHSLLAQIGVPASAVEGLGPSKLRFKLDRGGARDWSVTGDLASLAVAAKGAIQDGAAAGKGSFKSHDLRPLARSLGWPLAQRGGRIGLDVAGGLDLGPQVLRLPGLAGRFADLPIAATLEWRAAAPRRLSGEIAFEKLGLGEFATFAFGELEGGTRTLATPIGPPRPLPIGLDLALRIGRFEFVGAHAATGVALQLVTEPGALRFQDIAAGFAGGRGAGQLVLRAEGEAVLASARLMLERVALAGFVGPQGLVSGHADLDLDLAGAGDSITRLVASLGGGGTIRVAEARLRNLDGAGLARAVNLIDPDGEVPSGGRFVSTIEREFAKAPLQAGTIATPLTIASGVVRIGPVSAETADARFAAQFTLPLATLGLEGRGVLTTRGKLREWSDAPAQVAMIWTSSASQLRREIDASIVLNALTVRAVQRELARIEAMEADMRERAMHNRRLRSDRYVLQREQELLEFDEMERIEAEVKARRQAAEREETFRLRPTFLHDPEGYASELESQVLEAASRTPPSPVRPTDRRRPLDPRPRATAAGTAPQTPAPIDILPRTPPALPILPFFVPAQRPTVPLPPARPGGNGGG